MILALAFAMLLQTAQTATAPPLTAYVANYEYENGATVDIIANKTTLYAILDEAKYVLTRENGDSFRNGTGSRVAFHRDVKGEVDGFQESGHTYRRLTQTPSPSAINLGTPRPNGDATDTYRVPPDRHDGLMPGNIDASDLRAEDASAIADGILHERWPDVHSVLLYQRGKLIYEEYFYGYDWQHQHQLRSATKSVVATLAGIAVDLHAIPSVNEPVLPYMKYASYHNPDSRKAAITLQDILSMQSGLACDDHNPKSPGNEVVIDETPDWVKATMDLPLINPPGTKGFYCSGGVAVVGRMVENATHTYLPDFAQRTLFGPMGIQASQYTWNYNLTNANKEYSQIHLRPRDMMKLGVMLESGGKWNGHQIVSSEYAQRALSAVSTVDDTEYGYFWWRPWLAVQTSQGQQRVFVSAAQGNGGQKILSCRSMTSSRCLLPVPTMPGIRS